MYAIRVGNFSRCLYSGVEEKQICHPHSMICHIGVDINTNICPRGVVPPKLLYWGGGGGGGGGTAITSSAGGVHLFNEIAHSPACHVCMSRAAGLVKEFSIEYRQGRIEPPKAARGHATSYSARIDGIVLSVTKNNVSG